MRICPPKLTIFALLLGGACCGCGAGGATSGPLIPVKGMVTYKGQPLTAGVVRFEPDDGYGRMATGKLHPDGTFVLSTFKEADGVVPGHHRVFITDVEKKLAKDRAFKKYMAPGSGLEAEVSAEKTEFGFHIK
jgi:hypothetical protein